MNTKLAALVIGHKKARPGAKNIAAEVSEFDFNDRLAGIIENKVTNAFVQRVYRRTYKTLPDDINELAPTFIISLHCNASLQPASGTEVLYYHRSTKGKQVAGIIQRHLLSQLDLRDRGIKGLSVEDRGGTLLKYTNAPCVIAEPFFIDNDSDLEKAQENVDSLALAYAAAIDEISELDW